MFFFKDIRRVTEVESGGLLLFFIIMINFCGGRLVGMGIVVRIFLV